MSKELEAFENIKNITYDRTDLYGIEVFRKDLDIIETALKENKKLKKCYKNELKNTAYYNNLALKYKKALEMIKENLVVDYDESENDKYCLTIGVKVDKDKLVVIYQTFDENKIRLLKEIL